MSVTERRAREKAELRREILDAARRIFTDEGFEALTMRRVAEEIEYSPTTIYLYFKDKSELIKAICDELFTTLVRELQALGTEHANDPLACLGAGLRTYIRFGLEHPSHYYVTFIVGARAVDYEYEGSAGQHTFEFLRQGVRACMDAGQIRQGDVEAIAQALWAAMHGLVTLFVTEKTFPFVERQRLIDELLTTLLRGLRP